MIVQLLILNCLMDILKLLFTLNNNAGVHVFVEGGIFVCVFIPFQCLLGCQELLHGCCIYHMQFRCTGLHFHITWCINKCIPKSIGLWKLMIQYIETNIKLLISNDFNLFLSIIWMKQRQTQICKLYRKLWIILPFNTWIVYFNSITK